MAKKSSKSTRRSRTMKQEATKKKSTPKVTKPAVVAAVPDEPVVKAEKTAPVKKAPAAKKADKHPGNIAAVQAEKFEREPADELMQPTRSRMLLSACALGVIVIALVFGASIIRQQNANKQADQMVKSGQVSGKADQILQSGGSVCTNGNSQTDLNGSSNPQSVGMMLQSNPINTIQTPQTLSAGSDVNTLQSASCF